MGGHHAGPLDVMSEQVTGRGARGVVAAAAPLAAALGAEAIRAGGNAYDGAVTAALAETVLLPPKCGLGGDLVALRLRPGAAEPEALLAVGAAPAGLAAAVRRHGLDETGPLSVGPPAAPAGYAALAAEATRPLADLAAPAADLARRGFPWSAICTWLTERAHELLVEHQPEGCAYLPGGHPHRPGEVVRLPGLARALDELGARGARVLDGPLGEAVAERVAAAGGVLAADDLAATRAEWASARLVEVAGWRVWATPAPTHGVTLLDTLAGLAGQDPANVWRSFRAATERRRRELGDPPPAGTSIVSAADADGNVVVVIHSNSYPTYGSALVVPAYDLVLNNRAGRGFSAVEGHPNFPLAGRRPATTLHAWAAGPAGGRPSHLGGTPGGANQVSWNAQLLAELVGGERRPGHLVVTPRWEWLPDIDALVVEDGYEAAAREPLVSDAPGGWTACDRWGLRSAQQVVEVPAPGRPVVAAADPRTVGAVVGA
ncbi:MAG TPA: gamma-glutamyltransferase [Acidimicrobiales bacterium]